MTPLDLMKALRDVPEELIDVYTDDEWVCPVSEESENRAVQPVILQHLPEDHFQEEQESLDTEDPSRKRNGSAIFSYLMTAGCTAACIAGFALMIRLFTEPEYPNQEIIIPSDTQDTAVTEIPDVTGELTAAISNTSSLQGTTKTVTVITDQTTTSTSLHTDIALGTTALSLSGTQSVSGTRHTERTVSETTGRTETASENRRRTETTTTLTTTTLTTTTITTTVPPAVYLPEPVRRYCQTLVNGQPLWAEIRHYSYRNGSGEEIDGPQTDSPYTRKGMFMEIGCAQGAPGETVEIPVYISGVDDLSGFQLYLKADGGLIPSAVTSDFSLDYIKENMVYDPDELNAYAAQYESYAERRIESAAEDYASRAGDYASFEEYMADFLSGWDIELPEGLENADYKNIILNSFFKAICSAEGGAVNWVCNVHLNPCNGLVIAKYRYTIPEDAVSGTAYRISLKQDPDQISKFITYDHTMTWEYTLLDGVIVVQ